MSEERNQAKEKYHLSTKECILVILYGGIGMSLGVLATCVLKQLLLEYDNLAYSLGALLIVVFSLFFSFITYGLIVIRKEIRSESNLSRKEHGIALSYGIIVALLMIQTDFHTADFHSIWTYYHFGIILIIFIPFLSTMCCEAIATYKQRKVEGKGYKLVLTSGLLSILIGLFCAVGEVVNTQNYSYFIFLCICNIVILYPLIYNGCHLLLMAKLEKDSIL